MLDPAKAPNPATTWVEEPLQMLLDELPFGVVHLDDTGCPVHHNPAALLLLQGPSGAQLEAALGEMCEKARTVDEPIETALSFGHLGEVRVLLTRARCFGGFLAVLERNAAARVRAENQVMRSLLAAATESAPPEVAAYRALSTLGSTLAGSALVLYELDARANRLNCLAHVNVSATHAQLLAPRQADEKTSLVGRVMATKQPLHIANLARAFFAFERSLTDGAKLSALALPVMAADELLGVLYICGPKGMLTDGELKLVQGLAEALGALIHHARRDAGLKSQRLAMAALVENLPDAIFDRADDGTIALAEGRVAGLFGREPSELVGKRLDSLLPAEEHEKFAYLLQSAAPHAHAQGEFTVAKPGGEKVWCEVSAWRAPSVNGRQVVRTMFRDVTWRKRMEADFAAVRSMAIQRDRLAMIGQLAAGVAHEINNPLSFVKANISLIHDMVRDVVTQVDAITGEAGTGRTKTLNSLVKDIEQMASESMSGVDRIAAIVQSLKGMARTRPGEKAGFDPGAAVQQAAQFFTGGKHCRELVQVSLPSLPMVIGEAGGLSQAVLNLLDNAFDAVNGEGKVWVRGLVRGDRVIIEVEDDGPGIPPEVQPHIFEPFYTTKKAGKGTGLGLHISQEIITGFGGQLRYSTGPGGTTFTIELLADTEE